MGICEVCRKNRKDEGILAGAEKSELLQESNLNYMENYICIVDVNGVEKRKTGTGFFCKITHNNKEIPVLITNYHIISDEDVKINAYIEVFIKGKPHIININKNSIIYSSRDSRYDIMILKIEENSNKIYNYLEIDPNIFKEESYLTYQNEPIYILHFPNLKDGKAYISRGNGIEKISRHIIKHKCNTEEGSSGGPILCSSTNKVIGIHKGFDPAKKYNIGVLLSLIKFPLSNNYIIAEIYIKEEDINKKLRILNFCEYCMKDDLPPEEYMNQKEIKNCEIQINNNKIKTDFYHQFDSKGIYKIKYSFMNYLTKSNNMFFGCTSLIKLDLSNFNSQNITNMDNMFSGCSSLKSIDLSNFDTHKVKYMDLMFYGCSSLINLDLSNFDTHNVNNMRGMFSGCSSLKNIDISNFNTHNVTDMAFMFEGCSSLKNINVSSFDTLNVNSMDHMFARCSSLKSIDLSNFNTENVSIMSDMFNCCSTLENIDLSNFNTKNLDFMSDMFYGCASLKSINLAGFDTKNVIFMTDVFTGCISLKKENIITIDLGISDHLRNYNFK